MQPIHSDSDAAMYLRRWNQLQMHVRCGLCAHHPDCVRMYVDMGSKVAISGIQPAARVHARTLHTLVRTAQDEALPWAWRTLCLESVGLPLAQLTSILAASDPIALRAIEASVLMARAQLPTLPCAQVLATPDRSP
ncbi:hypothetical protein QTI66_26510 [Variovorax sp. J22R133]|uniref:hypothetical protein n=1 Tax=Variovorax brevis TaxID=3053503 RepID=UPI00257872AC|nr:hypothetical protein [Variovorax sp. J22R133]MDM0115731.1 hypothetical protein [Variovorax sp. J22R133]